MATISVEERLTAVENELAQLKKMEQEFARLKRQLEANKPQEPTPWWQQISGVFKDCPEFDEAMRLGREWRESQRIEYDEDDTRTAEEEHGSA